MWTTTTIAGRTAEVFTPAVRPRFVLLFLPDIDGTTLVANDIWTELLQQYALACVVPDGADAWWLDRVYPPFHEERSPESYLLDEVLPWVKATFSERPLAVAGVGMGGQSALRLGFRHPQTFPTVASLAAALDFHEAYGSGSSLDAMFANREQCRLQTAILHIQGWKWPTHLWFACDPNNVWHRGNDRLASKLTALGVPFTADLETTVCGHSWSYYDFMAPRLLRPLVEALDKESRRLM